MHTWPQIERWILAILGIIWLAVVGYAFLDSPNIAPLKSFGTPSIVTKNGGVEQRFYVIRSETGAVPYDVDVNLQIKGYSRPKGSWPGFYQKAPHESIYIGQGRPYLLSPGRVGYRIEPKTLTVLHSINTVSWDSIWRRLQSEHRYKSRMRERRAALGLSR